MKIELYYDKDCPFCKSYANFLKIKENHELNLFNARKCKNQIKELKVVGFDINNGFIIKTDSKDIYQGIDAINFLNDLTQKRIYFPNNYFFRNIVYPIVKYLRKLILLIKNKKINI